MTETTFELLRKHPFLENMSDEHVERLSRWSYRTILRGGEQIFDEGGRAERFWLILDGQVRLDTHLPGRGDVIIETLGPGALLGWSWLFEPYRWHFAATAEVLTRAVVFDKAGIRELCDSDPALGLDLYRRLLTVVVDRLQKTRLRLLDAYA